MIKSREELLQQLRDALGENAESDQGITLIEDFTDTYTDIESRGGEDWKTKYEENDRDWRKKYIERFGQDAKEPEEKHKAPDAFPKAKTFEELFKTE